MVKKVGYFVGGGYFWCRNGDFECECGMGEGVGMGILSVSVGEGIWW